MSRNLLTTLLLCLIASLVTSGQVKTQSRDCEEIKVKATITHTSDNASNGKIALEFQEPEEAGTYRILLFGIGWEKPRLGDKNGFSNLTSGFYEIYFIDKKGCSKQLNVQVK